MLKDGDGGFIRLSRPFFMVRGITVLYDRVRHQDSENILLTRRRIHANILLEF